MPIRIGRSAGLAFSLAVLLGLAAPARAERWFGSVSAGCDNFGRCMVSPAMPEPPGDPVSIDLQRAGTANAPLEIMLRVNKPVEAGVAARFELGPTVIELAPGDMLTRPYPEGNKLLGYYVAPHRLDEVLAAMRRVSTGRLRMPVAGQEQDRLVQLEGLDDALRYLDERQGRAGAQDAIIEKGPRVAADMAVPKPLPATAAWPKEVARLFKREKCNDRVASREQARDGFIATPAPGRALWVVACDGGMYNIDFIAIEVRGSDLKTARVLTFPTRTQKKAGRGATNPGWWSARNELSSFYRAHAHGDCGTVALYRWTERGFRLLNERRKDDCDGVFTDPWTTWLPTRIRRGAR